jgi:hypothetical protein
MFYSVIATGFTGVVTAHTGLNISGFSNVTVVEYTNAGGWAGSILDGLGAAGTGNGTPTAGAMTLAQANELVVGQSVNATGTPSWVYLTDREFPIVAGERFGDYQGASSGSYTTAMGSGGGQYIITTAAFKVPAVPAPSPASISPTSGLQGQTLNVTVTGTSFDSGGTSTLSFSGTGITVNSYGTRNATTLTANISIASNATVSARNVIVTNADTQTGTLSSAFTVVKLPPNPTDISPSSGAAGQTITNFTVNGTAFDAGASTISFSGTGITVNSYSVRTATQIVASITIASGATAGLRNVIVTNSDNQTGTLSSSFGVNPGGGWVNRHRNFINKR